MTRRTVRLWCVEVVTEHRDSTPPRSTIDTTGESLDEERTGIRPAYRPGLVKATPRMAQIIPLFRKAAG